MEERIAELEAKLDKLFEWTKSEIAKVQDSVDEDLETLEKLFI